MDSDLHYFGVNQEAYEIRYSEIQYSLSNIISCLDQMNFRNQVQSCRGHASASYQSNMFFMPQYDSFSNSFYDSCGCYGNADPYFRTNNSGWWEHPNCNYRREPKLLIPQQLDFENGIQSLEDVVR